MASLKSSESGRSSRWSLESGSTLIGRDRRCEVMLDARTVSRRHAEIYLDGDVYFLVDRDSRAGTKLNGSRLCANRPYRLQAHDTIEICEYIFNFEDSESTDSFEDGSVTDWIHALLDADAEVDEQQQQLWDRYFHRLVDFARVRLGDAPAGSEDEEDVAIRALSCFFRGASAGRFPNLKDRHGLWQLLTTITARQASNQRKKENTQKRGGGRVWTETTVYPAEGDSSQDPRGIYSLSAGEPPPDFLVEMSEQCNLLLAQLPDELKEIARYKLEGFSHAEIAAKIGKVERTVERRLREIRRIWSAHIQ